MINAKNVKGNGGGAKGPVLDAGAYPARFVQIIDLGVQEQKPYKGEEKPPVNEVILTYELSDEFMKGEDGEDDLTRPRWVSETIPLYNLQSEKANSTKRYYALDPNGEKEGDFGALLGTPCTVTIVQNDKDGRVYANVASISSMRAKEASKLPDLKNKPVVFDMDNPDIVVFNNLPDWIKEKIQKGLSYGGSKLEAMLKGKPKVDKEEKEEEAPW